MAFTNLAVFGGAFFTPTVTGRITLYIGWWWCFYLVAIFCAVCLPAVILLCPETAYRRDQSLNLDMLAHDVAIKAEHDGSLPTTEAEKGGSGQLLAARPNVRRGADTPKATFVQSLALFNGRKSDEAFWKLLLRPFPLFLQPAFLWASLIQGTLFGWTVLIGAIISQQYFGYPLWWTEEQTGYAYTAAFIGALLGFVIAGVLSDWSAKLLTRMNNGIYEPEFRILLTIPQLVLGCMGLYGIGITFDQMKMKQAHWAIPLIFFCFEVAGMVLGAVSGSLYIVDAYRE
jgi:MFS family permease